MFIGVVKMSPATSVSLHPSLISPLQLSSIAFAQLSPDPLLIVAFASLQSPLIPCVEEYVAPGEVHAKVVET